MAFATAAELASYLQVDEVDTYTAELVLDMATGVIRRAVDGRTIDRVTDDEVSLYAPHGDELILPDVPADPPTVVEVDGEVVTDYYVDTDSYGRVRLIRPYGWRAWDGTTGALRRVVVTYSHGFTVIPDDIKGLCLEIAAGAYRNPEGLRSKQRSVDDYSETDTYSTETVAPVTLSRDQIRAVRRALRLPSAGTFQLR